MHCRKIGALLVKVFNKLRAQKVHAPFHRITCVNKRIELNAYK